jgi:DNA polymerase III subunit gamma/tau
LRLITQLARPKTIREVAGQELTKQALLAIAARPEESPRVLILHGTYGIGKTSLARAFARAVNCKNKVNGDACGTCSICQAKIEDTQYYEEYDSSIIGNIEDIKRLREYFDYNSEDGYRVITIDEAHLLTRQAQSALLKVFEEVSSRVFFILCTTEKDKLLPTILSRSMDLRLTPISDVDMKNNLIKVAELNNIDLPEDILDLIVIRSGGHLRDAHLLLQNYTLLDRKDFISLVNTARKCYIAYYIYCYKGDIVKAKEWLSKLLVFPLMDLKRDYEALLLEIMECATGVKEPKDDLIKTLVNILKTKALNLYYIMVDPIIINSFESSNRFMAAQLNIYLKINNKIR